jgi:hypothetical protein
MPSIPDIGAPMALYSFRSAVCPACGGAKKPKMSLCFGCYGSLPKSIKPRLYLRLGRGYEGALRDALNSLKVREIHI